MTNSITSSSRKLSFVLLAISIIVTNAHLFSLQDSLGHGVRSGGVSRFFEIDNEQFSTNNVTVGETIEVTVELASRVNRDITISEALIAVSEIPAANPLEFSRNYSAASSDQWRIINATHQDDFVLRTGETMPFNINITALQPGDYHLHSAFAWSYVSANGTQINTTYYGRGATIQVAPSEELLQVCQELGISSDKCSQIAILQNEGLGFRDRRIAEEQQEQLDTAMYMIGIGAAIAGIMVLVMLRKRI